MQTLPVCWDCSLWCTSLLPVAWDIVLARIICEVVKQFIYDKTRSWKSQVDQHTRRRDHVHIACHNVTNIYNHNTLYHIEMGQLFLTKYNFCSFLHCIIINKLRIKKCYVTFGSHLHTTSIRCDPCPFILCAFMLTVHRDLTYPSSPNVYNPYHAHTVSRVF